MSIKFENEKMQEQLEELIFERRTQHQEDLKSLAEDRYQEKFMQRWFKNIVKAETAAIDRAEELREQLVGQPIKSEERRINFYETLSDFYNDIFPKYKQAALYAMERELKTEKMEIQAEQFEDAPDTMLSNAKDERFFVNFMESDLLIETLRFLKHHAFMQTMKRMVTQARKEVGQDKSIEEWQEFLEQSIVEIIDTLFFEGDQDKLNEEHLYT